MGYRLLYAITMGLYEFVIKDKSGKVIASVDGARDRWFELYLNKSGAAGFTLSTKDPKATGDLLLLGNKELYIYRAGTLVWGGELSYRRVDLADEREQVMVTAKGFFELLAKRLAGSAASPRVFSNTDAGTIAWTLINESQIQTDGDFGITQGTIATSKNRDRTYEYKSIKDAIEGLSSLNIKEGFDFEVGADKKFTVFYPRRGRDRNDIVFEWGKNIVSFYEIQDATDMANRVIVLGEGQGTEMKTVTRNADATVQSQYKIREKLLMHKDVKETVTLNDHGDKELSLRQVQQQIVGLTTKGNLEPALGAYTLGDSVRVKVNHGLVSIDQLFRIYGIRVTIDDQDDENIDLIFNPI